MSMRNKIGLAIAGVLLACSVYATGCKDNGRDTSTITDPPTNGGPSDVEFWLTNPDKSALLQKQHTSLLFKNTTNQHPTITVDETTKYQSIDGFGYCLTGGSATLIHSLPADAQDALLK